MKRPLPMTYKPSELQAALEAVRAIGLDGNNVVIALYNLGYRIVYTGEPKP